MRGSIDVHRYLTERQIPHEFYRLGRPLRHIEEAAALLGLHRSHVVTAELFEGRSAAVLALVPAAVCASSADVARESGEPRVRPASPTRVAEHTGFLAHWLPPVGHDRPSKALMDEELAGADVLYAAGGDPGVMLVIRSEDLLRATAAAVARLATSADTPPERPDPVRVAGSNLLAG